MRFRTSLRVFAAVLVGATVLALVVAGPANARTLWKLTKPSAPTSITAFGVNTAIVVSWEAPLTDGGSPITGYIVRASRSGGCTTTSTTCTVFGLSNTHPSLYRISVRAVNEPRGAGTPAKTRAKASLSQNCFYIGPDANLQSCDLAGANLSGENLTSANLTDANLTDANLTDANLTGTDLSGTNLTADLSGVISGGITGSPSALAGAWQLVDGYLVGPGADLAGADLAGISLAAPFLPGANLTGANLTDASLTGGVLSSADLDGATLTNADLSHTDLGDANLTGVNLSSVNLNGVSSGGIVGSPSGLPSSWSLVNGYLVGPSANLTNAILIGTNLTGADLAGADLFNADLDSTNLTGANLTGAGPSDANLTNANLTDTNLTGANFTGADLAGVTWSNTTCPDSTNSSSYSPQTCVGHGL